jgi:hypothetical protein
MSQAFRFNINEFMPRHILDAITEIRVMHPKVISEQAAARRKRAHLTRDGKLVILACDHPQRGVLQSGSDPLIMGNRHEYLGRALRIITNPALDGVMAPPDLIEDLFIVDYLIRQGGGPSFLDERVLIGCMQRGGVAGVVGEINDRFGAYTPESIAAERLDGGKMMYRFVTDDAGTLDTIDYCSRAVTELHRRGLFAFVEPLPQEKVDGKYKVNASVPVLIKLVNVSAALGESSQHTWLKIPYVDGYDQVALATTLPILMLGGESAGDVAPTLRNFEKGLGAGASVRGAMIGRNILFPGEGDPLAAALAVNAVIHHSARANDAFAQIAQNEGKAFDALTRWIK